MHSDKCVVRTSVLWKIRRSPAETLHYFLWRTVACRYAARNDCTSRGQNRGCFYQAKGLDHRRLLWWRKISGHKQSQCLPALISLSLSLCNSPLSDFHSPVPMFIRFWGHCILMSISNFSCLVSSLTPLIHQYIIRDKVLWTPAAVTR